ncbi:S-methyl-5-thioribose kinase [Sphaerisporangium perillae]|uniref:S-methyl-5-thioribose kinase n=1 Tax=Sphaerisporangium perillae TaxID=2935860 RepID=UPI00200D6B49|nr:S-methyl-5-thioribose kinase [Sphaerisporangium perillae]
MTATIGAGQSYGLLTADTVPAYIAGRPALASRLDPALITGVREVGDGNLNLVFIVEAAGVPGLVLKQSLPYVRTDPGWPMTPDRNASEARALRAHGFVAGPYVPAIYEEDAERHVVAIEDLSDHRVWRGALNEGLRHEDAAADLGRYAARVAFGTSVFGLSAPDQKAALVASVNPQLCQITEDLVYTEPYIRHEHNVVLPANEPDVAAYAGDPDVRAAVGAARLTFMTHAEALIHGDLHTGSVLVRAERPGAPRSTKAFDTEFAFYGPAGFDVGALWGNYVLAAARALALGDERHATWVLAQAEETWRAYQAQFRELWPLRVYPRVFGDTVRERFLAKVRGDAVAVAGAKAARRIIGFAKVSDIETLPEDLRARAARGVLRAARLLLVEGLPPDTGPSGVPALFDRVGQILTDSTGR